MKQSSSFAIILLIVRITSAVAWVRDTVIITNQPTPPKKPGSSAATQLDIPPSLLLNMAQSKSDRERFEMMYPHLRDTLLEHFQKEHELPPDAMAWCHRVMDYNVPGGKLHRGLAVAAVLRALTATSVLNTDQYILDIASIAKANILGWALEFVQANFLIADDVVDGSETRRGQRCWYKQPDVQLIAINDAFLLQSFAFTLINLYFGDEPYATDLINLFLTIIQKTEIGQLQDLIIQPPHTITSATSIDFNRFTLDRFNRIAKYKTAYYSFYWPVAVGMILSGIQDPESFELAESISVRLGEYYQIENDYLDCYGDPNASGKIGTDIQERKCSWLIVQALQRCTPQQRQVLELNYGQWSDEKVQTVKQVFDELNLVQVFAEYKEESYQTVMCEIEQGSHLLPPNVFELLLRMIFKRNSK